MEVGPTCHYMMGGVRVEPDTTMSTVKGLFAAGEVAGGLHGRGGDVKISKFLKLVIHAWQFSFSLCLSGLS
jgi:hypothetical protein